MELYHYGVRGMRWGVRRYQNKDGTLTPAGEQMAREALETYGPVSVAALTATAAATRYTDPTKKHKQQGGTSKWR